MTKKMNVAILCKEFFHKNYGGFGGYGMVAKNVALYLAEKGRKVFFIWTSIKKSHGEKIFDNIPVYSYLSLLNPFKILRFIRNIRKLDIDYFITIENYPEYVLGLFQMGFRKKVVIWLQDTRTYKDWSIIASDRMIAENEVGKNVLKRYQDIRIANYIFLTISKIFRRKVVFATQAKFLVKSAEEVYMRRFAEDKVFFLPNPISIPKHVRIEDKTEKPSFLFLGRLDPIKRPQIYFALAEKMPQYDFYVAGQTHFPKVMNTFIEKYKSVPNLHFLGQIDKQDKDEILRKTWFIINTSIHEALPVSFLEALSYSCLIISCQNPDNITQKFGYYVGSIGNEPIDAAGKKFKDAIENMVNLENLKQIMISAHEFSFKYSYESFHSYLKKIEENFDCT